MYLKYVLTAVHDSCKKYFISFSPGELRVKSVLALWTGKDDTIYDNALRNFLRQRYGIISIPFLTSLPLFPCS